MFTLHHLFFLPSMLHILIHLLDFVSMRTTNIFFSSSFPIVSPHHMSLKRTARNIFFGTEILGTMPTLGDNHSSNFAC